MKRGLVQELSRRDFCKAAGIGSLMASNSFNASAVPQSGIVEDYGGPTPAAEEVVLFPFDDFSVPLRYRLQVGLVSASDAYRLNTQTVLEKGKPGTADGYNLQFYGTIKRIGDELRMWYLGMPEQGIVRICYAVSKDGIHWTKPELGLVEYKGNKRNNYVDFDRADVGACVIYYEPEDPNADRRFKMVVEISPFEIRAAFSPDGLHWKESSHNPILKHNAIEPGGLTKFNGCYYLTGQGGSNGSKRALVTYLSYDFENWTDAVAVGLRRDMAPHRLAAGPHAGEQVHLGAALWNRGNVLLGVYGQWHGESNDRSFLTMDLGFVVSNDAMHFREPIPDFQIVSAYEVNPPGSLVPVLPPTLEQGQAFENIGDKSYFWYSPWYGGFISLATWERDRLGYFQVVPNDTPNAERLALEDPHSEAYQEFTKMLPKMVEPHFISCPLETSGPDLKVFLNAAGLGDESYLTVELLDEKMNPLPGYSGSDCIPLKQSGLRQLVTWRDRQTLQKFDHSFRLKVKWNGSSPTEAYVYAVYISAHGQV